MEDEQTPPAKRFKSSPSTSTATTARDSGRNDGDEIEDHSGSAAVEVQPRSADRPVCIIPPEIITLILFYLPLDDRKSARLSCKLLNECSRRILITEREKVVIPGSSSTASGLHICEVLTQIKSAILNIEFRASESYIINSLPTTFWSDVCGDRVRHLYFHCSLNTRTIKNIFLNCHELQTMEIVRRSRCADGADNSLEQALDGLIKLNVRHQKLLILTVCDGVLETCVLQKMFKVFPNLEHLNGVFKDFELTPSLKPLFMQLRGLSNNSGPSAVTSESLMQTALLQLPMTRLSEFRATLRNSLLQSQAARERLLKFLESQSNLEKLSLLYRESGASDEAKLTLFGVLKRCLTLREFEFSSFRIRLYTSPGDEVADFLELIKNLRRLKLEKMPRIPFRSTLPSNQDFALNMLVIDRHAGPLKLLLHILQYSARMQHLFIGGNLSTGGVRDLFRTLPSELRTLNLLGELSWCGCERENEVSTAEAERLQNLEYLELPPGHFEELPIWGIQLRRLKHVKLSLYSPRAVIQVYRKILGNMPALETMELPDVTLKNEREVIQILQHLQNLRYLDCAEVGQDLKLLFQACPSLRFVSARNGNERGTFSFNSSTACVTREPYRTVADLGCKPLKTDSL